MSPMYDAGTATRHYRAFWQRRCRAAAAGAVLKPSGGNCAVLPLFQDAGCFIEVAGLTVDLHRAVCHCTGDEVKVVGTVLVGIPALDHLAVGIIADPLAAVRFLVRVP